VFFESKNIEKKQIALIANNAVSAALAFAFVSLI